MCLLVLDLPPTSLCFSVHVGWFPVLVDVLFLQRVQFPLITVREIKLLQKLNHKNVVQLREVVSETIGARSLPTLPFCVFSLFFSVHPRDGSMCRGCGSRVENTLFHRGHTRPTVAMARAPAGLPGV